MRGRSIILLLCVTAALLIAVPAAQAYPFGVTDISPDVGNRGGTMTCTVCGNFFYPLSHGTYAPRFTLRDGWTEIQGTAVWLNYQGTRASVTFAIPPNARLGLYDLYAEQWDGGFVYHDVLCDAFCVEQGPVILGLSPSSAAVGSSAMTMPGRSMRPRAMATRCFCPPESSSGFLWPNPSSPTIPRYCIAFCRDEAAVVEGSKARASWTFSQAVNEAIRF